MRIIRLLLAILMIGWMGQTYAQDYAVPTFRASKKGNIDRQQSSDLSQSFKEYTLVEIDYKSIYQFARQEQDFTHFQLELPDQTLNLPLEINNLRKEDYLITLASGKQAIAPPIQTYKGRTDLGLDKQIRMTISDDHISGYFLIDGEEYYLEPASKFTTAGFSDDYVLYNQKFVILSKNATCGATSTNTKESLSSSVAARSGCVEADIAIAADYSYYIDHGSDYSQVITDLEEVFNIVDGIFQTDVDVDLEVISYFISDCASCDPWTTSTSYSTLLNSFRNWGQAGGFLTSFYDVASFWSNRDFDGSVVGYASVKSVCSHWRYNINQDYTSNLGSLKTLWAHELGHNFGSWHDDYLGCPSGHIMWPSVLSGATSFSSCSIDAINTYLSGVSCLVPCNTCPANEHVTSTYGGTTKIEVDHQITAENNVTSGGNVIYDAGYEVDLLDGFDAQDGCDFLAVIDGCGGSYKTGSTTTPPSIVLKSTSETIANITSVKCFPNPFTESTTLSYTLTSEQVISLSIFSPTGQEITKLLDNKTQKIGTHEVSFNGEDLPKGVYFYRFISEDGQHTEMGKMMLVE